MLQIVVGPLLFAIGLLVIYTALNGLPTPAKVRLKGPRTSRGRRLAPGDTLVVDILSEMLSLREQVAALQDQVGSLESRPRRQTKAAS